MASIVSGLIKKVQIDDGAEQSIASTAYGICSSLASSATKTVDMSGFTLEEGITIHVKFENNNTASNPTLNVNNTGDIPLRANNQITGGTYLNTNSWNAGSILTLTLEKNGNNYYWITDYNLNTTYTFANGTNSFTVTPSDGNSQTVTVTPELVLSVDNADLGNTDYVVIQEASDNTNNTNIYYKKLAGNVVNATLVHSALGTNSTHNDYFLRKDGTWVAPPYPVTEVAGLNGAIQASTLVAALGLSNAMHFIGIVDNSVSNNTFIPSATHTRPSQDEVYRIVGLTSYTPQAGDVILDPNQDREYVYTSGSNPEWLLLGQEPSSTYNSDNVSASTSSNNTWISNITQDSNRVITIQRSILDTSGTWTGDARSLETAREIYVDLTTTRPDNPNNVVAYNKILFDGTTDIALHVNGILPLIHGGTGASSINKYGIVYGNSTQDAYTSTTYGTEGMVVVGHGQNDAPDWYPGLLLTSSGTPATYSAAFSGSVTIDSTLDVTGNTTIGDSSTAGTLDVYGATTLYNILDVTGATSLNNTLSVTGDTTIGDNQNASTLDVYGATTLYSTLDVTGATTLDSTLNVTGNTIIGDNQTASTLDVYGSVSLYDTLSVTDATTLSSTLEVVGTTKLIDNVGIGDDPESGANAHALYVSGTTLLVGDVDITGNIEITGDILPSTTNTYTLGSANSSNNNTDNGQRWKGVYIGTDDTYGDPYTPVYWNDGTPETVAPIQYISFSITGPNNTGVKLTHEAITENSYVLEIVVTDGISYLTSPIEWATFTEQSNGNTITGIKLECNTAPDYTVVGYIIISRGDTISVTSTSITV